MSFFRDQPKTQEPKDEVLLLVDPDGKPILNPEQMLRFESLQMACQVRSEQFRTSYILDTADVFYNYIKSGERTV